MKNKLLKYFIALQFSLLIIHSSLAQLRQGAFILGDGTASSIIQTSDGGYAMAGSNDEVKIVKLDKNGNMEWTKIIGSGNYNEVYSLVQTKDGGYAMAGYTSVYGAGGEDVYVVKLNSQGNLLWTRTIGGGDDDWGNSITQTKDGGFAITGGTKSYGGGVPSYADVYVIKLDSQGNKLWTKTIEGPWGSDDEGESIIQTREGGYAVTGRTLDLSGWPDVFIFKLDTLGNLLWALVNGNASDYGVGYSIIQSIDGGFAITGYTASYGAGAQDVYVIKLDSMGTLEWNKTIGGKRADEGSSIVQTKDKGYAIAGFTNSFGVDSISGYILKLDSFGNLKRTTVYSETEYAYGYSITQTKDAGYAVAGGCSLGFYFLKLDSLGNSCVNAISGGTVGSGGVVIKGGIITSSDSGIMGSGGAIISGGTLTVICEVTSVDNISSVEEGIEVYPNPSNGKFFVSLNAERNGETLLIMNVYNVLGQNILAESMGSNTDVNKVDINKQPNGIYLFRILKEDGTLVGEGKLIIQK